jgi:hypothetical protein
VNTLFSWMGSIRPSEWASMIFGTISLVVSLAAYKRSRRNERHARELEFAQERQETLVLVRELQLGDERMRRQIGDNLRLARDIGIPDIIERAAHMLALMEGSRELLVKMQKFLDESIASACSKHELLVRLRGDVMTALRQTQAAQEQRLSSVKRLEERLCTLQKAAKKSESC